MPAPDELKLCPDETELLEAIISSDNRGMAVMRQEAETFIRQFCEKYNIRHASTGCTYESGFPEPIYYFTDNLGGYTIGGIKGSLKDYFQEKSDTASARLADCSLPSVARSDF